MKNYDFNCPKCGEFVEWSYSTICGGCKSKELLAEIASRIEIEKEEKEEKELEKSLDNFDCPQCGGVVRHSTERVFCKWNENHEWVRDFVILECGCIIRN